ncbi:MAG: hypothetical protein GY799_12485 [Desulfobulbaceae bacterium]|nr:hypothetical protein [Desulfobulbaceae bacterium]
MTLDTDTSTNSASFEGSFRDQRIASSLSATWKRCRIGIGSAFASVSTTITTKLTTTSRWPMSNKHVVESQNPPEL